MAERFSSAGEPTRGTLRPSRCIAAFTSREYFVFQEEMPYQLLTSEATFALGEIQTSKRGQKFAPICASQPLWQLTSLDEPLYCPFGAGVYGGDGSETRLNLDVRLSDTSRATFEKLDKYFKEQFTNKCSTGGQCIKEEKDVLLNK